MGGAVTVAVICCVANGVGVEKPEGVAMERFVLPAATGVKVAVELLAPPLKETGVVTVPTGVEELLTAKLTVLMPGFSEA
jgi:hypothetical protein